MDVMSELAPARRLFEAGDYSEGLVFLRGLWERVPEPKTGWPDAYNVLEYAVAFALRSRDLDEAWVWACRALIFREARHDLGEAEFLVGRVAFERGDTDAARRHLLAAERKSEGRILEGEDPKWRALISGPLSRPHG